MARILVIGDDLTGVNGTGAGFARQGLSVATVSPGQAAGIAEDYDVVVVNTDSRHCTPRRAAARVAEAVRAVDPVQLVVKRTDSTLRGNIGAEIEAVLEELRDRYRHSRVRGLMVPAFPEANRVTVDAVQLLDGIPLERTELATDPLNPIRTSAVPEILAEQTTLNVRHVPLREVTRGAATLAGQLTAGEEPLVLCDAFAAEHIVTIGQACAEVAAQQDIIWVSVDPGPMGAELARALSIGTRGERAAPLLAVVGSTTELTRRQLELIRRQENTAIIDIDPRRLTDGDTRAAEDELVSTIDSHTAQTVVVLRTSHVAAELSADRRQRFPVELARLVDRAVRRAPIGGIYTSGGDVTAAVLAASGSHAFEVDGEIVPLAVRGTVVGGALDGLPAITKGGLVGDDETGLLCVRQLRAMVELQRRRVRTSVPAHHMPTADSAHQEGTS